MTHAPTIRRLFALEHAFRPRPPMPIDLPRRCRPGPGQITLITGPSGGGKSSLLAAIRQTQNDGAMLWIEPSQIRLPDAPVIDCVCGVLGEDGMAIERALELLGRVGLAEAWTYLQRPSELSDGQRWRLMLAMAVATAQQMRTSVTTIIAMDEFAALLDRITARVVARALRRLVRPAHFVAATPASPEGPLSREEATQASQLQVHSLAAIVATSHDDLVDALLPDMTVLCDFDSYSVTQRLGSLGVPGEGIRG